MNKLMAILGKFVGNFAIILLFFAIFRLIITKITKKTSNVHQYFALIISFVFVIIIAIIGDINIGGSIVDSSNWWSVIDERALINYIISGALIALFIKFTKV